MYDELASDVQSNGLTQRCSVLVGTTHPAPHPMSDRRLRLVSSGIQEPESVNLHPARALTEGEVIDSIAALIEAVSHALAGESESARRSIQLAGLALARGFSDDRQSVCSTTEDAAPKCRGGLAPWQVRRLTTHIESHLAESVQCEDLAQLVNLSLSHFMRAFRESFGCPPHAYLMRRRMEYAQGLMLTTNTPLGQIALDCGLADQSHLSRLFHKFVGETPAAWRRARVRNTD
jgi:AraC-like DNA-binding protein